MSRARFLGTLRSTSLLIAALAVFATPGLAESPLDSLARDGAGREAVEALARQPGEVREAALRVSARPDLIVRIEGIRSWTSRGFDEILDEQPEAARADLWELVRYPELIDAIVLPGEAGNLEDLAAEHPPEVRRAALAAARNSWDALVRIHALQRETDAAFDEVLGGLDPELAAALETVVDQPSVLSVLAENLHLTVALGEAFERDPDGVLGAFADLEIQLAQEDQAERDEWANALEDDPELRAQVDEAAEEWEDDYGPSDAHVYYGGAFGHVRPYPYWYGYPYHASHIYVPSAHAYALWYPHSYWGHIGYYYDRGHSLVVLSAPSFPFLYWLQYRFPSHHYYSSHHHWRRVQHVSYYDGRRHDRHHAHHYRNERPNQHSQHARHVGPIRSGDHHFRTGARLHEGRHGERRPHRRLSPDRRHSRSRTALLQSDGRRQRADRDRRERRPDRQERVRRDQRRNEREQARVRTERTERQVRKAREERRARAARKARDVREQKDRRRRNDVRAADDSRRERQAARGEERRRGKARREAQTRTQRERSNAEDRRAGQTRHKRERREADRAASPRRGNSLARSVAPDFGQRRQARSDRARGAEKVRPTRQNAAGRAKRSKPEARPSKPQSTRSRERAQARAPRGSSPSRSVSASGGQHRQARAARQQAAPTRARRSHMQRGQSGGKRSGGRRGR